MNKSLHKSESFFTKVDAAENDKSRRKPSPLPRFSLSYPCCYPGPAAKGKPKKDTGGKQTTLFGLPAPAPPEKKLTAKKGKKAAARQDSQATAIDSQDADVVMVASTPPDADGDTQPVDASQVPTEVDAEERAGSEEPIEWPESPVAGTAELVEA